MSPALLRRARLAPAALALALCGCADRSEPAPPRRVVLVTLDTLRYDAFEGAGAAMPRLAELAARRGLVFERFHAATSSTQPTHATLFTGLHPWQHGVSRNGAVLDAERETLAELLRAAGFHTAAAVASFPVAARFGFAQGFDEYRDELDRRFVASTWEGQEVDGGFFRLADEVSADALELLDRAPAGDQFLWLHYFDPHAPYGDSGEVAMFPQHVRAAAARGEQALQESLRQARALYDADVAAMDARLRDVLDRALADERYDTWIVVTADHGESFGEHGVLAHGNEPIPSQVHVPLVLIGPGLAPGRRADVAGSIDLFATVLAIAGLEPPAGTAGRDLRRADLAPQPAVGMTRTYATPLVEPLLDGRLRQYAAPSFYLAREGEFALGSGRGVARLDGAAPADEAKLRALFGAFEEELERGGVRERLDRETQDALESLGYTR